MTPITCVIRLFLHLYSRQAFLTWGSVFFISNQSEAASVLCQPIGAKRWPISEHRENCSSLSDWYLYISKYHLAYRLHNTRLYGACRNYADFLSMMLMLRRFRIVRCKRQAALHSALFNYTPLVIRRTSKNKQLTIVKPTQTGIYRNKYTFCTIKSLEPLKNSNTSRVPQLGQVL
jgi:hypothetical protein